MTEVYQVGPGGEVTPASETGAALTPAEIVEQLDRYIVGQDRAKKAVAIALRNRTRRQKLPDDIRDEIIPKNILMIGPTGVGKTEIARRLAALAGAPFVKVEATKFTEVGYVGRDVDSMVRDLVQVSYRMVEAAEMKRLQARAKTVAADRLLDLLQPPAQREENPFQTALGRMFAAQHGGSPEPEEQDEPGESDYEKKRVEQNERLRARLKKHLEAGDLDERQVEIEVDDPSNPFLQVFSGQGMEEMGLDMSGVLGPMAPRRRKKRTVSVAEARQILEEQAARDLVDQDKVSKDAIELAEQTGIIFVDEIDKVAGRGNSHESGPQVSREGVQRDILPIVEGATVVTKYGPCRTDHVLFIAAGAFHMSKPSDLIPELQGRLPIRVELDSLSQQDFVRILTEPKNALVKQYAAMLGTEGVTLEFTDDGIEKIAEIASDVNSRTENIGARRLHTVMEKLLEDVSFDAAQMSGQTVRIDAEVVSERLGDLASDEDLSRYIL